MPEYLIEGERVTASRPYRGRRVWRCACPDFELRREQGKEYCPHVALVLLREARAFLLSLGRGRDGR
jgi:hypothetical protein